MAGAFLGGSTYQLNLTPNWICRGSNEAVGRPASVQITFTSATFRRFQALKMSIIPSTFIRSPMLKRLATRRSLKMVCGRVPALRGRLPRNGADAIPSVGLLSMKQAGCIHPVGEVTEGTAASPQLLTPAPGTSSGRSVLELRSKLLSEPVKTLNGRPELHSRIGATVHPLKIACFAEPLEPISPL